MFAQHLFELKSELNPNEFIELLNLLKEKTSYDRKNRDSETTFFTNLVNENIEYLIEIVSQTKSVPKCLIESSAFRNECIKRKRIDLAIKCILPSDITENEKLINVYCKELNIDSKDFYERGRWLLNYHEKNNNIFNTFLATSLKDNIFNLNKEHYERCAERILYVIAKLLFDDGKIGSISEFLERADKSQNKSQRFFKEKNKK